MRITILLVLFMAGCASMEPIMWEKSGSTKEDFKTDDKQCEEQALHTAPVVNVMHVTVVYSGCMEGKGWSKKEAPKEAEHH